MARKKEKEKKKTATECQHEHELAELKKGVTMTQLDPVALVYEPPGHGVGVVELRGQKEPAGQILLTHER